MTGSTPPPGIDLDALEKAALAATPGPWARDPLKLGTLGDVSRADGTALAQVFQTRPTRGAQDNQERQDTAHYIALCSPETVLALVRRIRELEASALNLADVTQADVINPLRADLRKAEAELAALRGKAGVVDRLASAMTETITWHIGVYKKKWIAAAFDEASETPEFPTMRGEAATLSMAIAAALSAAEANEAGR